MTTYHHPGVDSSETLCGEDCGPEHVSTRVDEAVTCVLCIRMSLANQVSSLRSEVADLREQIGLLTLFVSEILDDDGSKIDIMAQGTFQAEYIGVYNSDESGVYHSRYFPEIAVTMKCRQSMDMRDYIPPRVEPSKIRLHWTKEGYRITTGLGYGDEPLPEEPSSTSRWADL